MISWPTPLTCDAAGSPLLEEEPKLLLKWRVAARVLATLSAALTESSALGSDAQADTEGPGWTAACGVLAGRLTEKGVLQLLFDARFVMDPLSGGRPVGAG